MVNSVAIHDDECNDTYVNKSKASSFAIRKSGSIRTMQVFAQCHAMPQKEKKKDPR